MSMYEATVPQLHKMVGNIGGWLEAAAAHAKAKAFDPNVFVHARLAPDQYPLARQVQSACDSAKFAAARLSGKEAPKHPDTEQTLDELRARVKSVFDYLGTFKKADFEGVKERLIELPFMPGKVLAASDYLNEMVLPNFYFHATHVYAILRHNGVDLGKMNYIGSLNLRDK